MPTAQNSGKPLSMNIFKSSGGGGGGPVAALITQQAESQRQFQKMMQTIEKLQQQNALAVEAAGQAGAGAATQVANQVASGMQRARQENRRETEREDDKAFARESQQLNADLQKEATKEAAAMGQAINAHHQNLVRYAEQSQAKKLSMKQTIAAARAMIDLRLKAKHFSSKAGREEFAKLEHLINMAEINADDHFDDKHLNAAFRLTNENIQRTIAGEDMDLAHLEVDPLRVPYPDVQDRGGVIADPDSISPDKKFEFKTLGGYPLNGVLFNDEENFGLAAGNYPRIDDADILLQAVSRDQYSQFAMDQSIKQELNRKSQEVVVKAHDVLQDLYDTHTNFNKLFNPRAPQAIEASIEKFLARDDPRKFNDIGRELVVGAVQEMFGGAQQGEKVALIAMEIFDGKRDPSTREEAVIAMAIESAVFNLKEHMRSEFMTFDDKGAGLSTELVSQMVDEYGEDKALLALGVNPESSTALVGAHKVMQGHLEDAYSFSNQLQQGVWNVSALEDFRKELKINTVLKDIYAYQNIQNADKTETRLKRLMSKGELSASVEGNVEGMSPEEAKESLGKYEDTDLEPSFSLLSGMIKLADEIGNDAIRGVASLASGGAESSETPNLQAYMKMTQEAAEKSGYIKPIVDRVGHRAKMNAEAKLRPTVQQSFQQGGVGNVVREQAPALLSLGGLAVKTAVIRTGAGLVQMAGGQDATRAFSEGVRVLGGKVPIMSQGEHQQIQNLDPAEQRQIGQDPTKPENEQWQ